MEGGTVTTCRGCESGSELAGRFRGAVPEVTRGMGWDEDELPNPRWTSWARPKEPPNDTAMRHGQRMFSKEEERQESEEETCRMCKHFDHSQELLEGRPEGEEEGLPVQTPGDWDWSSFTNRHHECMGCDDRGV